MTFHFRKPCLMCADNETRVRAAHRAAAGHEFALSEVRLEREQMRKRAAELAGKLAASDNEVSALRRALSGSIKAVAETARQRDAANAQVTIWREGRGELAPMVERIALLQTRLDDARDQQLRDDALASKGRRVCACEFGTEPVAPEPADADTDEALRRGQPAAAAPQQPPIVIDANGIAGWTAHMEAISANAARATQRVEVTGTDAA